MIGEKIGHYTIERHLGEGGMGVVYAARDEKLHRTVALKLLRAGAGDPRLRERLWREARAAAGLSHPGVCQVHEVGEVAGEPFLVMELLEGETLADRVRRGPLPPAEVVRIGVAALDVLAALHARGLVHRDLKPTNLFLLGDGRVKLLDFGLVLPLALDPGAGPGLTLAGTVMGSPGYMAPEQIRGGAIDARADLFALAATLHEAASGAPPFRGATPMDAMIAVLQHAPPRLAGPGLEALDRALAHALEKRAEARPADARALAEALRAAVPRDPTPSGMSTPPAGAAASPTRLAVMPFRLLRPDADLDFLGTSLADAIALSLAGLRSLVVRSTHAAARYSDASPDLARIAAALDVDAVLLGTLLPAGERVRVTAQLVEAPGGRVLWSQTSDVTGRDVFALQDELVKRIVAALELPLSSRERSALDQLAPVSSTAYELFLRANRAAYVGSDLQGARVLYLQALDADPRFAAAWARLGRCYRVLGKYREADQAESYRQAEEALERALAIAPDHPGAHHVKAQLDLDLGRSEAALERLLDVVARNPNDPEGWAGLVTALRYLGFNAASVAAHHQARSLDRGIGTSVFHTYRAQRDYDSAMHEAYAGADLLLDRGMLLFEMGRIDDSIRETRKFVEREKNTLAGNWAGTLLAMMEGDASAFRALSATWSDLPDPEGRFYMGEVLMRGGELDHGFRNLSSSLGVGYCNLERVEASPYLGDLHDDPRLLTLIERARAQHEAAVARFGERVSRVLGVGV